MIGSAPDNLDRYFSAPLTLSRSGQAIVGSQTIQLSEEVTRKRIFSVFCSRRSSSSSKYSLVAPEKVTAFELGYRGVLAVGESKVSVDLSGYYNTYEDFISTQNVLVPFYGQAGMSYLY